VAECKGQLDFWICDDHSEWSSFRREIASRNGAKHRAIAVPCVAIRDLIGEFGVPHYIKIDIEGYDGICIAGLNSAIAPQYISIEMDHLCGASDLGRLAELGYKGFKIICQNNAWHQVTTGNLAFYRWGPNQSIIRRLTKLRTLGWELFTGRKFGESGPWGEKTSGTWHSVDHARLVWRQLCDVDEQRGTRGVGWWFDIHAKK
jgi:hypothetical protein